MAVGDVKRTLLESWRSGEYRVWLERIETVLGAGVPRRARLIVSHHAHGYRDSRGDIVFSTAVPSIRAGRKFVARFKREHRGPVGRWRREPNLARWYRADGSARGRARKVAA